MNNQNLFKIPALMLLTITVLLSSCSDDSPGKSESGKIKLISSAAIDVGNDISSEDVYIKFSFSAAVDGVRLFVVPSAELAGVLEDELLNLSADKYMQVSTSSTSYSMRLNDIPDINGDDIENGTNYSIGFMYESKGQYHVSDSYGTLTLTDKNPLLGSYTGIWNDNLFSDIPISFRLENESETSVSGPFFISNDFTTYSNTPGDNGTITLRFEDNQDGVVSSFTYNQNMPVYQGGCPGTYTGDGTFQMLAIDLDFTGNDCDGAHSGGKIKMTRKF